ncbi:DEAD/DEAH box helicase [Fructilactobacillus fructivorans]|uniref:DEAD/DEAH box helicase n=1 Tax=Fructilactobacillus fructivorans TaxID=1614 RepID=UPI0007052344|nr:DEAD/DEAH box helicase [Fructilactobacillus fructivorans]KRN43151.1 helicase domain-containing protein [Fructilactobacillus fructivorans]
MIKNRTDLMGRFIPDVLVDPLLLNDPLLEFTSAVVVNKTSIHCNRCGFNCEKTKCKLPNEIFYCPNCIEMGRIDTSMKLVTVPETNDFMIPSEILTWKGNLTSFQRDCASKIITSVQHQRNHLLWAVTGAGKTEMLFPVLKWAIKHQKRIAIASPRVDVCSELYPRLQAAFSNLDMVLLHGKSKEQYRYCQLTICTTHQLMRFFHAFDLLIIDEVDAFPFVANVNLKFAVTHARKRDGQTIMLSATPGIKLREKVIKEHGDVSYLPLRFHGHLLPQIKVHLSRNWRMKLTKKKLPKILIKMCQHNIAIERRFSLFVPQIKDLAVIDQILQKELSGKKVWDCVYSADSEQMAKVQAMRDHDVLFLITTTILERGVTFPDIDVMVLGADDPVFSTSSLVQTAGRVGRKKTRPTGNVDFFVGSYSGRIRRAQSEITIMNRKGMQLKDGK